MPNSIGKTDSQIRKFLRENGVTPNVSNVERIGREIRRTEGENATVERIHRELERERGIPATRDERGDVRARVKESIKRKIKKRDGR